MHNLKIGIIGCGKIADSHASQIIRMDGADLVAAFDTEELMARQFCERFEIPNFETDVDELLERHNLDVVHITTPPESHFSLALKCMENGCHIYVEKPVTLYARETVELIDFARRSNLKMTVGHDAQFSPSARLLREKIKKGYIGEHPVHMESLYCYDLSDPVYAKALMNDSDHWVRRLPGMLLQNIISHGIAKLAEYLVSENPKIVAYGFTSPLLKSLGETEIVDELRVIIDDGGERTAYFTFSSQMRPSLNAFRVFGQKNGLVMDETQQTVIQLRGERYRSFGERFIPALGFSKQYLGNAFRNVGLFLRRRAHFESGKYELIKRFYRAIREDGPVPISYREIALTAWIMDQIFEQMHQRDKEGEHEVHSGLTSPIDCGV